MLYDVIIVGGGPAGLAAALTLGRARRRILLLDNGPRRNAAAAKIYNFVTRDGTPPDAFRELGRAQLERYPKVETKDARVATIEGSLGAFRVALVDGPTLTTERVLLCTGMIDERLPLPGFDAVWGTHAYQCPYCHGWEVQDQRWGFLVLPGQKGHALPFAALLRGWTDRVTAFLAEGAALPDAVRDQLAGLGVQLEGAPARLVTEDGALAAVELSTGARVAIDVLYAHPPQRQVELVRALGPELDEQGYVRVDAATGETSIPGVHAAGDLTTRVQAALLAAASGSRTAAAMNLALAMPTAPEQPSATPPGSARSAAGTAG